MQSRSTLALISIALLAVGGAVWYLVMFNSATLTPSDDLDIPALEDVSETGIIRPPHALFNMDERCTWVWNEVSDVGIWGENCTFGTDVWKHEKSATFSGFNMTLNGKVFARELEVFEKGAGESMNTLRTRLEVLGVPSDDCEMRENTQLSSLTSSVYEIVPTGKRLERINATEDGEIPADECGIYGVSANAIRTFRVFADNPTKAIFLNYAEEGPLLDINTLSVKKL